MTRFTRRAMMAAITVATLAASGLAQAQDRTFKFALQNPKGHPLELGAAKSEECQTPSAMSFRSDSATHLQLRTRRQ